MADKPTGMDKALWIREELSEELRSVILAAKTLRWPTVLQIPADPAVFAVCAKDGTTKLLVNNALFSTTMDEGHFKEVSKRALMSGTFPLHRIQDNGIQLRQCSVSAHTYQSVAHILKYEYAE